MLCEEGHDNRHVSKKKKKKSFVGLAYQGKDIVFRFIIVYNSLMGFGPY
jgi:hypothetical protein